MFEKVKRACFENGYIEGLKRGDDMATHLYTVGEHGITYASPGDYMMAKVEFNKKDTKIADLSNQVRELEKQVADSSKTGGSHKTELDKCHKDLERFYLEAIGNTNTVKQVKAVMKRYRESELGKHDVWLRIKGLGSIGTWASSYPILEATSTIGQAAATKIKRINRRDAEEVCDMLDTTIDRNCYASSMAAVVEGIANIEVDRTKVLDAKDSGLDAWNVLLSLLSANSIKHDDVLGAR